jgi:hypothetical protein
LYFRHINDDITPEQKVVKSEVEFGLHYKGNNKITELRTDNFTYILYL